ncbi:MAG: hypothetical protein DRI98_08070 [Bacteroidetes bacterium]|nr:MAG: hypothetical protein DRI98_08070 [Bacteroidota bacterium]
MTIIPEDIIIDNIVAEAELEGQECVLNHHDDLERPAVDFLCHQMGFELPGGKHKADSELRIPVCEECVQGLTSGEWILFYCVGCNESQWLQKKYAKMNYQEGTNIIALKTCPKCHNELLD